ncbi:uncharacterized protein LOC115970322 [Quercus lobata]|uniref:uncharacterized protein LOC115970322 n=1 Tax=Quercus lobata TaxID=97700 RepID=UPI0012465409|nr:uncharacterized protein LOC115970322 [Quercus lobata]
MSSAQEQWIISPLHPAHRLTLQKAKDFRCGACFETYFLLKDVYGCSECNFNLDLECAKISLATNEIEEEAAIEEGEDLYFIHGHTLKLYKNIPDDRLECGICGSYCSDHACCCFRCSLFLHPSCSLQKYLRVLDSLLHPQHPLTLLDKYARPINSSIEERKCNACRKHIHGLAYACHLCRFYLHVECSVIKPSIKFQGHRHFIHFREDIKKNQLQCSACNRNVCESHAFTCLDCDFNLHLGCGPLPYIIQNECHMDPLVLTISPVIEEDETDEFYCHVCEEERDSQLPVYYCADCHFIAEINCVYSQVASSLKGELDGHVELRNTLGGLPGILISVNAIEEILRKNNEQVKPTSTLRDIVDSLSKEELNELSRVLAMETVSSEEDDDREYLNTSLLISVLAMETATAEEGDNNEDREYIKTFWPFIKGFIKFIKSQADGRKISEQLETFLKYSENDDLLSERAHMQFLKFLDCGKIIHKPWESQEELVNVGDYMVPLRLVPILTHLLSKHEDVSAKSFLSPKVKLILLNILCECIYSMTNIKVVDITAELLQNWWTSFKILQFARFETSFAFNHLKRVAQACFALFVEKKENFALDNIHKNIANHCEATKALEENRDRIKVAKSAKSSLIEEWSRDASVLKYRRAGTGLLTFSA